MDIETFREDTRRWLETNAPTSLRGWPVEFLHGTWGGRRPVYETPDHERWLKMMAERGWTAPTWPAAYGGGGLSAKEAQILREELKRLELPPPLIGFGLAMIGPTLLEFGTEAQKQAHIPAIVRGEIRWCQGYSEPGAGSDLASLATSAVKDGDRFIINGQKVWTSYADEADWIFCLVRTSTGSKQGGITFILIDMATPGITTRPIRLISGASPFCEVFFTDVMAEAKDVVGQVDSGWTVAKALLGHERTMVGEVFAQSIGGGEAELVSLARERGVDPLLRDRITRAAMDEAVFLLTVQRMKDTMNAAKKAGMKAMPGPESSILKLFGSELNQRRHQLVVELMGTEGLSWNDATREWLRSRGNSIEGGTSEVQLDIIAKQVLGLGASAGAPSTGHVMKMAQKIALQLTASPEQRMLAQTVASFFKERGLERHRALRDAARERGEAPTFSREVWRELGELGVLGLLVPEADDGSALGMAEVVHVAEAMGRALAPEPFMGSAVWATSALVLGGNDAQNVAWLPKLISGEAVLAIATDERGETRLDHGRLYGTKVEVIAGAESDAFIVTGVDHGEPAAWLVRRDAPGLSVTALDRIDSYPVATVTLSGVPVDGEHASPLSVAGLALARERATVALCAEMLGGMNAIFETTLAYLDERVQFGVKIGTFQALRHRAARAYVELELSRSAVSAAAAALDQGKDDTAVARLVSLAKARCAEAYELIAADGIQMHGGIGMTDEHVAGFFFKRARVAAVTLGSAARHRDRWATIAGY